MQIFTNGKRRFYPFMEFYVIYLNNQGVKNWSKYHFIKHLLKWRTAHVLLFTPQAPARFSNRTQWLIQHNDLKFH